MDPQQTFRDLFDALQTHDAGTARELALALQEWLDSGGFWPEQISRDEVQSCIAAALHDHDEPEPLPFSLVCFYCDAGDAIETEGQALAAGWTDIQLTPDLPQANYCGVCPECRYLEDE